MLTAAAAGLAAQDPDCPVERQIKLTVQSSMSPSLPGQSVTFGVFVEPVAGISDPTGTVQLADDAADLGTFPLKLSQTSITLVFNTAGAHIIRAFYGGDFNYCAAFASFGQGVNRLGTSLALTSSAATVTVGAPVTLIAQIAPATPAGVADPTGQVQFLDNGTAIGSAAPVSGKATLNAASLSGGTHQITAVYSGDPNWYQLRSAALSLTVGRTATATALAATASPAQATLMATVSANVAGAAIPSGTVQFMDTVTRTPVASAALPGAAAAASVTLNATQIAAAGGHPIAAVYSGDASFTASTSNALEIPALINSASGDSSRFAAEEQVSLFGSNLTAGTLLGPLPLPTSLGGVAVSVTDSAGVARPAGLILASPAQINLLMPAGLAAGAATVSVTTPNVSVAPLQVTVAPVAPGLYSVGSNGKGLAAAQIIRVHPDGTQTAETLSPAPISFGTDTLYLVLYGTGIRGRSAIANVTCTVGAASLPVSYAGAQTQYPGLDQVDLLLPTSLKGSGQVNVTVTVDAQTSNVVTLTFQ